MAGEMATTIDEAVIAAASVCENAVCSDTTLVLGIPAPAFARLLGGQHMHLDVSAVLGRPLTVILIAADTHDTTNTYVNLVLGADESQFERPDGGTAH